MIELIKELSDTFGPCGLEDRVAEKIYNKMLPFCDKVEYSPIGSVIATIYGEDDSSPVMLSCAMDETTFMIGDIDGDGFLKLKSITNHDPRALCGRYVTVGNENNTLNGVMSSKVLHLTSGNDRSRPALDKMFIDIGKNNADAVKETFDKGDFVTFAPNFSLFGKDKLKGKALDSRVNCAILIEAARKLKESGKKPAKTVIFSFNVKEKAGKSSAFSAVNKYKPNTMILLSCYSVTAVSEKGKEKCKIGDGVILPTHDHSALYFGSPLYKKTVEAAKKNDIKIQIPDSVSISNSAANSERTGSGVSLITMALPCLNIRSNNEIVSKSDIVNMQSIVNMYINGDI